MADANSIRIIYIFEACSRLRCKSEISALAAHIYHRFFRIKPDMSQFELYTFGSASIMLAHRFYERDIEAEDLAMVAASIVHGPECVLDSKILKKLANTINSISLVIAINTNFEVSFKNESFMTPGDYFKSIPAPTQEVVQLEDDEQDSDEEVEEDEDETEYLLTNNCKNLISGHRYLAHYLYSMRLLVEPSAYSLFNRLCNIAWTFLNDFHWSPAVMCHLSHHIACSCLMMACKLCIKQLDSSSSTHKELEILGKDKEKLRNFLGKKWNLIFCDDLPTEKLNRTILTIIKHYGQYESIFRKEFTIDVIDP